MRRDGYYVLDGHEIKTVDSVREWGEFFKKRDRIVAQTSVGESFVSTVFIGIDHNWFDEGPPILFETLIFNGPHDQDMWRYATWDEAKAGHDAVVEALREGKDPDEVVNNR